MGNWPTLFSHVLNILNRALLCNYVLLFHEKPLGNIDE